MERLKQQLRQELMMSRIPVMEDNCNCYIGGTVYEHKAASFY